MAGASRIWKFVKSNWLRKSYDVDLLGPTFDFLRFFTTRFELRAIDRSVFCHLSSTRPGPAPLSHNLRRHRSPSRRQLEVACLFFVSCVISIEYPSIDLSVHLFASPAAAGFVCYTAADFVMLAPSVLLVVYNTRYDKMKKHQL